MLKEQWPSYLDKDFCSQLTFDLTPTTTGVHTLSVLTTGTAVLYIDSLRVFTRKPDQQLQREAFYFFRSTFERRFTHSMNANQTYSLILESWAATPEALSRSIGGPAIQGSSVGFHEFVDIPAQISSAAAAAANSDVAIIFTGTTAEFEPEGYDRDTLDLTSEQYDLVAAVTKAKPRRGTILINYSGAPVNLVPFLRSLDRADNSNTVQAILQCWFPGQECGHSIAALLTGRINPSGRLPMSWPARIEDSPSFGNFPADENDVIRYEEGVFVGYRGHDLPGRTAALFPFGFGLSYTRFQIGEVACQPGVLRRKDGRVNVRCDVANVGEMTGKVVLQFYVVPPVVGGAGRGEIIERPLKELKAFEKVEVGVGAREEVSVELDRYAVSYYDEMGCCWRAVKGTYAVLAGFSAVDIVGRVEFEVEEEFVWTGV
jgi:beta-glucosidase